MADPSAPIDRTTLNAVRKALAVLKEMEPFLEAAEAAGFGIGEEQARHQHYKGLCTGIINTYEPILNRVKPKSMEQ